MTDADVIYICLLVGCGVMGVPCGLVLWAWIHDTSYLDD